MTTDPELRYVSLTRYHSATHGARGRQMVTICGKDLDDLHVERLIDRLTCNSCQELLDAERQEVPA